MFDQEHARRFNDARHAYLQAWLPDLLRSTGARTAIDLGCALGYFTAYLSSLGLETLGIDGREENIAEARSRYPELRFAVGDVTDRAILGLGSRDVVLCFGLLYHLEDTFAAVRNLATLMGTLAVIESMVVPSTGRPVARVVDETVSEDQSLRYVALVPSEPALVKMLYSAGVPHVYRPRRFPDHEDFRATLGRRRRRTMLLASRVPLTLPWLRRCAVPRADDPWERPGHLGWQSLRRFVRKPLIEKVVTVRRRLRR